MNSTVKMHGVPKTGPADDRYRSPRPGEPPVERTWTTIAAEVNDVVQPDEIGKRRITLSAAFAYREEALDWLADMLNDPDVDWIKVHGPTPCAMLWHGKTDSPSNAWTAEVQRDIDDQGAA